MWEVGVVYYVSIFVSLKVGPRSYIQGTRHTAGTTRVHWFEALYYDLDRYLKHVSVYDALTLNLLGFWNATMFHYLYAYKRIPNCMQNTRDSV